MHFPSQAIYRHGFRAWESCKSCATSGRLNEAEHCSASLRFLIASSAIGHTLPFITRRAYAYPKL